ncbi:glycosyltransferase family 2 protein [Paraburkholderia sp. EG285A]|uniref:glycosyltransferase family 2 protein n=1 Tax=Paraburkholderia sp. EG285A TaxID=3237009 RepID=UPI0034D33425
MPTFSVIVPVYNVRDYLEEALVSIERQSFRDFEAIVVDDGSTDGSAQIALTICARDKRFKYIRQDNAGLSAARNAGMERASGAYLYFLDSDDMIDENTLHHCNEAFTQQNVDVVLFGCTVFSAEPTLREHTSPGIAKRPQVQSPLASDEFVVASIEQGRYFVQACCYAARRSAIGGLRFVDGILYEDNHYFAAMLLEKRVPVAVLDRDLFKRRLRSNSIMTSRRTTKYYDSLYRLLQEMCALTYAGVTPVHRENVKLFIVGQLLGDLHNVSADLGPTLRLRITNVIAMWHVATRISVRVLTFKRMMLAIAPELYGMKLLKRAPAQTGVKT